MGEVNHTSRAVLARINMYLSNRWIDIDASFPPEGELPQPHWNKDVIECGHRDYCDSDK